MSIGQLTGRATLDGRDKGWGTCDRCGKLRNYRDLQWQHEWSGFQLINLKLLVCTVHAGSCLDIPNQTLRAIVLPPDPIPIKDPRPGFYQIEENQGQQPFSNDAISILFTNDGQPILTEDNQYITVD